MDKEESFTRPSNVRYCIWSCELWGKHPGEYIKIKQLILYWDYPCVEEPFALSSRRVGIFVFGHFFCSCVMRWPIIYPLNDSSPIGTCHVRQTELLDDMVWMLHLWVSRPFHDGHWLIRAWNPATPTVHFLMVAIACARALDGLMWIALSFVFC